MQPACPPHHGIREGAGQWCTLVSNLKTPEVLLTFHKGNVGWPPSSWISTPGVAEKRGAVGTAGTAPGQPGAFGALGWPCVGLTFMEETPLPIQSSASAPHSRSSLPPLGDDRGAGQACIYSSPNGDTVWPPTQGRCERCSSPAQATPGPI